MDEQLDLIADFAPDPPIDWPTVLKYRKGSDVLLEGISVWHDFNWIEQFGHNRRTFPHGKKLAAFVKDHCPEGLVPHLVLTTRSEEYKTQHETKSNYTIVVNVDAYLKDSTADPALTFFAKMLGGRVASVSELREVASQPDGIAALAELMNVDAILRFIEKNPHELPPLIQAICERDVFPPTVLQGILPILRGKQSDHLSSLLEWALEENGVDVLAMLQRHDVTSLRKLSSVAGVLQLKRLLDHWRNNGDNGDEEFWQKEFTQNAFVLSQAFFHPVLLLRGKAFVGPSGFSVGLLGFSVKENPHARHRTLPAHPWPSVPLVGCGCSAGRGAAAD